MAKILITSALPYINGIKHLGNLIGSMLSADVYARFMRAAGNTVLFICATDEHGTPAEIAAHEEGLPVEEYCRKQHEIQAQIYRDFALSFDYFGRSSSPQNHELTSSGQSFWLSIHASTLSASTGSFRNRCLVSRTSRLLLPEIAERASLRSVGSSSRVQFSHWSPRALG